MYHYTAADQQILNDRVAQFRDQTRRFLDGQLPLDTYRPLRLQNGLYVQRHAPMLRVNVPYGMLSSTQLRMLAEVARKYDKGYGHITTRQNIQYNWPKLEQVPDLLADLASVQMHGIQSSGNCIRNTTSDEFAGIIADEVIDPRPYCEIIRQWSTLHPEFAFLPRKFKIAVTGATEDRAAIRVHDIGVQMVHNAQQQVGYRIFVGGGLGRTPVIGTMIRDFLPEEDLLTYLEAILRVYNLLGRRDNKYKARIKILVRAIGNEAFAQMVEKEWGFIRNSATRLTRSEIDRVAAGFVAPPYRIFDNAALTLQVNTWRQENPAFDRWMQRNVLAHKQQGYAIVHLSLKPTGTAPGDVDDSQLDAIAALADDYSFGEVRTTHKQNIVLGDVEKSRLFELWQTLDKLHLATPNIGTLTDIICCPGGDFCSLANAKSIPVAEEIQRQFENLDYLYDLGNIDLNISGCMNACGHHHVGHIGILGVDKKGEEFYQVSLGGNAGADATLGDILGPSFARDVMADVMQKLVSVYVDLRQEDESFLDTYRRTGIEPFRGAVYA